MSLLLLLLLSLPLPLLLRTSNYPLDFGYHQSQLLTRRVVPTLLVTLTSTLAYTSIAHAGLDTVNRRFTNGRSADPNRCHLSQSHSIHHLARDHGRRTTTTSSTARARAPAQLQQKSHVSHLHPGLSLEATKLRLPSLPQQPAICNGSRLCISRLPPHALRPTARASLRRHDPRLGMEPKPPTIRTAGRLLE